MEPQDFITLVLAGSLLAPGLTAIINRPGWSRGVRQVVAILVAAGVAVVAMLGSGGFTGDWYVDLVTVLGLATFAYEAVWKPSGVAESLERATTPQAALPPST